MRLHLPKKLLAALATAFLTTAAATLATGSAAYGEVENITSDTNKASNGTYSGFNVSNNATLRINNGNGSAGQRRAGDTVALGPTTIEAGSKLLLWSWTDSKITYSTTDKVTIAGDITLNGSSSTAATLYMEDGSYNFSGKITVVNKGLIESKWAKGYTIQSLTGNTSADLTFKRGNSTDTGQGLFYLTSENAYKGTISLLNATTGKDDAWNNLVIGHANALKDAAVNLGTATATTSDRNALELNVASASVRALSGVGTVRLRSVTDEKLGAAALTSAALTITGSDNGVFSGTIARGVDLVIGENASQTFSGASIGSTITNNGSLTIESSYTGGTIIQGENGALSLASGTVINLDSLTHTYNLTDGNGIQDYTISWTLASGGTVVDHGATYALSGSALAGTMSSGTITSSSESKCYVIASESENYSNITETGQTTFDFIYVAGDGALVADADISHALVSSGGSTESLTASGGFVKVDGTGISYSGAMDLVQGSNLTITKADNRTDPAGMTISGVISGAGGLIVSGDVTVTLTADNTFTGGITIKSGSTLKLSGAERKEYCGFGGNSVTVESGATFDLNGTHSQERLPQVTLKGGTLQNSGVGISSAYRQLGDITLTENSKINAAANFGIIKSFYADASINLGSNNTLTKVGSGEFYAASTAVTGTGKIRIEAGAFNLFTQNNYTASSLGGGVDVELAGGELKGSFANNGTSTIHGVEDGIVSAAITNNGTLKVTSEAGKVVTFSGAITNGANGAVLQIGDTTAEGTAIGGTAKLTAVLKAATVGQIEVLSGSSLILDGVNANGDYAGTITVHAGGRMLAKNNTNYNIVNGGNGKFVLDGEFAIESTGTNNVNGISGSGVVKTAQNATLNIVCEASGGTSTLDESGSTTPTSYTSNFNGSVEASGSAKTVSLVFTGPSDATEDTPGSSGTTVSLKSLSATNGSTLNAKGIADYSVTTDPDSGVKTATGGLSVSELVIGTGSKVQAWGSGDTWSASAEATVLMKGAEGAPVTLTVGTAGQTGTSTLNANLVLDGATVTLNNALTMGSTLTLNDVTLSMFGLLGGHIAEGTEIILFRGVDSLTLGTGTASAAVITTESNVDASTYFTNLGQRDFLLTYTGGAAGSDGIVALVAQRAVPEPTTATLSLLALMGLAARRRRRKA